MGKPGLWTLWRKRKFQSDCQTYQSNHQSADWPWGNHNNQPDPDRAQLSKAAFKRRQLDDAQEGLGLTSLLDSPHVPTNSSHDSGWWQASDNQWYPPELHPESPAFGTSVTSTGWWLASDNQWYPPELHPNYQVSQVAHLSEFSQKTSWAAPIQGSWAEPSNLVVQTAQPETLHSSLGTKLIESLVPEIVHSDTTSEESNRANQLWNFGDVTEANNSATRDGRSETSGDDQEIDLSGSTYLVTGLALVIIYVAMLIEVLNQHAVIGLTILGPIPPLILTARLWIIRNKIQEAGPVADWVQVKIAGALALRVACILMSIVIMFSSS